MSMRQKQVLNYNFILMQPRKGYQISKFNFNNKILHKKYLILNQ